MSVASQKRGAGVAADLNGLAQPHLVSEDSVQVIIVKRHQPAQPTHLVLLELTSAQHLGLFNDCIGDANVTGPSWRIICTSRS